MPRPKGFTRDEVLTKAIGLFWAKGFADTSLQDLEHATGLNKSSLYSEFDGKEDIFLKSLEHYFRSRSGLDVLRTQPKGWKNVETFLLICVERFAGRRGCFSINSMREAATLPSEAIHMIEEHNDLVRRSLVENIASIMPRKAAGPIAETVLTFFSGLCIEENLSPSKAKVEDKIKTFLAALKATADHA